MANKSIDQEAKKAIKKAQKTIREVKEKDGNEAETRRRVERIFESVLGYKIENLSREHAVKGAGSTEHLDFAVKLSPEKSNEVSMVVELKRASMELSLKHLKQASRYAIDLGCEWALLTNGWQWELHHIEFGQPPDVKIVKSWDILNDEIIDLVKEFQVISYHSLRRGTLEKLWAKYSALSSEQLLSILLSESSLKRIRGSIKKESGISVHPEEIVSAFRRLLNEKASRLIDSVKISYPFSGRGVAKPRTRSKSEGSTSKKPDDLLENLYKELHTCLLSLGDDVEEKKLKHYVAFKRHKNFASIKVFPSKGCVKVWLKVDPDTVTLETDFARDVRNIGHIGAGDLEVTLHKSEDLQKVKPLIQRSYDEN